MVGYSIKRAGNCYDYDSTARVGPFRKEQPMRSKLAIGVACAALFVAAVPAWAHHAFSAEFDVKKPIHFTGVITKVELEIGRASCRERGEIWEVAGAG